MAVCGIFTTAFSVQEDVVRSYFMSLVRQTYTDFDIIIINDGFDAIDNYIHEYSCLNIVQVECGGSIAKNREVMINYACHSKYDFIIFCDFDDFFADNRVQLSVELLGYNDVVVNDLLVFGDGYISNDLYLSNRFANYSEVGIADILERNFFGLSNTAIRKSALDPVDFPVNQIAVDWYFFTNVLYKRPKAIFTNDTHTYYRQHKNSLAGIGRVDVEQLKKEILVKKQHYGSLQKLDPMFEYYYRETCNFEHELHDIDFSVYLSNLRSKINACPLWWGLFNTNWKDTP